MIRNEPTLKMSRSEAGTLGGKARIKTHGNPGTKEGRRRGGLHSLKYHRKNKTDFKSLKRFKKPKPSKDFAEFIGIMFGDGHIGKYQATVTTNSTTDFTHALYVQSLVEKLFDVKAPITFRKGKRACVVVISSRAICTFLASQGLPQGSKVAHKFRIPSWITKSEQYTKRCLRGMFDTDGSIYCDHHIISGKSYRNIGMTFTNRNRTLSAFFKRELERLEFHPTQSKPYAVFLRRAAEIQRYLRTVGSSNPKHVKRYLEFRGS